MRAIDQPTSQASLGIDRLGIFRSVSTGAFSTFLLYLLCWAGAAVGLTLAFSHSFIGLFTSEPVASLAALWVGGLAAFLVGGLAGALIAHCYNLAGRWIGR